MVLRVATGKVKDQASKAEIIRIADETGALRVRLTDLIRLDALAYENMKTAPAADLVSAWKEAVLVPLDIAANSLSVLKASLAAAQWSPFHTLSDVVAASALAVAGVEGGTSTVETNVSLAPNGADGESFRAKASEMRSQARNLKFALDAMVTERYDKSQ